MFTVIYYIQFGKDCQAVFPPVQSHLIEQFEISLNAAGCVYSRIELDESGNPIPSREEVSNV